MKRGAERLLVVDDEATVRELLSAALRFAGFEVTSAATAGEAVAAATAEPPDLVLLDVMLPDMDGFEVVRRLRERRPGTARRCPSSSSPRATARPTRSPACPSAPTTT